MLNIADLVIATVKRYFKAKQLQTTVVDSPSNTQDSAATTSDVRPTNMLLALWKSIQKRRATDATIVTAQPTSELDCWLESEPENQDQNTNDSSDFVRNQQKEHASQQPQLAAAARNLLPCSALEVDVERLFSSCRDKYGIRRHSLKAETVRVLMLLQSVYMSEDKVDKALIKEAMKLDVLLPYNSIIQRPDTIEDYIQDSKSSILIDTIC